jgi:hypothetical protein
VLLIAGSNCVSFDLIVMDCSMVAAFGSGAVFSAVSGMGGPNLAGNAVTTGIFFALIQGAIFKVINLFLSSVWSEGMNF